MRTLSIDIETFSSEDLKKVGLFKYAQSPDFEILLFAYRYDYTGDTIVLDFAAGEQLPDSVKADLDDPNVIKTAFNATFEWYCISRYLYGGNWLLDVSQWRDTMLASAYCGYPLDLKGAGEAIGIPADKKKLATGKALIRLFCTPTKPTKTNGMRTRTRSQHEPEKWLLFIEYNRQDVVAETDIAQRLMPWPVPDFVQDEWVRDVLQNERGVRLDMDLVNAAMDLYGMATEELMDEARAITGLSNPNSDPQLIDWINNHEGRQVCTSLAKDPLKALLRETVEPETRRLLEIRRELGKTSCAKYVTMQDCAGTDGRARGVMQFYGANRTGREAGRLIQVQNLPRTSVKVIDMARDMVKKREYAGIKLIYGSVQDLLSNLIRTALIPSENCIFADADYSAIEARVIAWLAGEEWVLQVFRTHGKIYEATASQMFGVELAKIAKGNPEYKLRQQGKVAQLALGYQGGVNALTTMDFNNDIPDEDKPGIVDKWRKANPRIVEMWNAVENAAFLAVTTGRQSSTNRCIFSYEADGTGQDFLTIQLPSGRKLFYPHPKETLNRFGRPALVFMGQNQTTRKWEPVDTYGGKLVENIVQAVARDLLMYSIMKLEEGSYKIAFHVHDEVVIDEPLCSLDMKDVYSRMGQIPAWAEGLPLNSDGWSGPYYTKD